jgi:hypothetical protein
MRSVVHVASDTAAYCTGLLVDGLGSHVCSSAWAEPNTSQFEPPIFSRGESNDFFFESESSDLVDNQNRIIDDNLSVQLFSACTTFPFLANPCTSNSVSKKNVVLGPLLVSKLRIGMILFLENGIRF